MGCMQEVCGAPKMPWARHWLSAPSWRVWRPPCSHSRIAVASSPVSATSPCPLVSQVTLPELPRLTYWAKNPGIYPFFQAFQCFLGSQIRVGIRGPYRRAIKIKASILTKPIAAKSNSPIQRHILNPKSSPVTRICCQAPPSSIGVVGVRCMLDSCRQTSLAGLLKHDFDGMNKSAPALP
jgi:hypothetical protein